MKIEMDDQELKHGLLGLVLAVVEVVRDTLKIQAVKRMDAGHLTDREIERLGNALIELDRAIDSIKEEQGVSEAVRSVRDGLDDIVARMIHTVSDPGRVSMQEGSPAHG
ncbi:MAG: gas vesicle protein K [Nitrospirae bacterium]|nr:gas vesicle protein K [Nitrospirota bacterium]